MPSNNGIKISLLPEAQVPLAGTESVPLVQNGVTKRVAASEFFATLVAGTEAALVTAAGGNNNVVIGTAQRLLVNTAAGAATITGFAGGTDGRMLLVTVTGANDLTLADEDGGSIAANQLYGSDDLVLPQGVSLWLIYSGTLAKWVMV